MNNTYRYIASIFILVLLSIGLVSAGTWNSSFSNGLISYYNFNAGSGSVVKDIIGSKYNISFFKSPPFIGGVYGYGISLNGINQSGNITHNDVFNMTGTTYMVWFNMKTIVEGSNYPKFLMKGRVEATDWGLGLDRLGCPGNFTLHGSGGAAIGDGYINDLTDHNYGWQMILFTTNATGVYLYLNGSILAPKPVLKFGNNSDSIFVGTGQEDPAQKRFFNGTLDEIAIWNRSLSPEEIIGLWDTGIGTFLFEAPTFGLCSSTAIHPVLNLTFIDEITGLPLNVTMDTSTWVYTLGSTTGSFIFSNTTHNDYYLFCINPSWSTPVQSTESLQYSSSQGGTFPQRRITFTNDTYNNNSLTTKKLYLLNFNNGITSNYQVINVGNQVLAGVYIQVQRSIGGTLTEIASGYTDDAGGISFFLSPNYAHTFTVSKVGYSTLVKTITPSSASYTFTMATSNTYFNYSSPIQGITYSKWPPSGIITDGQYNFTFVVYSRNNNIYNCTFNIRYSNWTLLGSVTGCNSTYPAMGNGGTISKMINVTGISNLYGEYLIEVASGTIKLEGDARWVNINITSKSYGLINALNETLNMPEWGDNPQTNDFSRIVFFFIFFAIILAIVNFYTSYDTAYPGSFVYIMTLIVILLSAFNGFTGPGFFYLDGAVSRPFICGCTLEVCPPCILSQTMDNWILPLHFLMLALVFFFTTNKRYQSG